MPSCYQSLVCLARTDGFLRIGGYTLLRRTIYFNIFKRSIIFLIVKGEAVALWFKHWFVPQKSRFDSAHLYNT